MRRDLRLCGKWILIFSIAGLTGCASYQALRGDFTNYSEIYGDESNKQLLLNLARLANEAPVYYIQLGTISSQYQVTESLQFNGGNTRTTTQSHPLAGSSSIPKQVQNALGLSGQANLGVVQSPLFSFVPLTGSNLVQAVLAPINDKVYLTFYDQGFEANLIARTIISQVEWQHFSTNVTHENFTPAAITIQTRGLDSKVISYIRDSTPVNCLSYDTNALLIRPKLMSNTNLLAKITNSVISTNDISWDVNSFVVQTKSVASDLLRQVDPEAISIYTNSITIHQFSFSTNANTNPHLIAVQATNTAGSNVLSLVKSAVPASATSVGEIIVNTNSMPQNVWSLVTNTGLTNAVSSFGDGRYLISLDTLTPDMAAYLTNSIYTNCVTVLTNYEILVNNPLNPTYWKFLEFCSDLRDAQICRMLTVDTLTGSSTTTNVVYGKDKRNPSLADVVGAIGANLSVATDNNGNIIVSQASQAPHFVVKGSLNYTNFLQYTNTLNVSPDYSHEFIYNTALATTRIINASNLAQSIVNKRITVKTRTLESAMYWIAREEKDFQDLRTGLDPNPSSARISFASDDDGPFCVVANNAGGGSMLKVRPIMTLAYNSPRYKTKPDLCGVTYNGKRYRVADALKDDDNSNGEVFTMLSYLFAQTAISTQNLPVQQLIQVQ